MKGGEKRRLSCLKTNTMNDRELNKIEFEVNNLEENFYYGPEKNYGKPVYKRYSALESLESEFESDFENLEEHLKLKGLGKKIGKGIKKAAKKVGEKIKKVAKNLKPEDALFLPLVPFKGAIKKRLKNKGITPKSNKLRDLAKAFHQAEITGNLEENLIDDAAQIVKDIIGFLKKITDKAKAGQALAEDLGLAEDVEQGASEADDISEEDMEKEFKTETLSVSSKSEAGLSTNTILILVAVVAGVYFISKKS